MRYWLIQNKSYQKEVINWYPSFFSPKVPVPIPHPSLSLSLSLCTRRKPLPPATCEWHRPCQNNQGSMASKPTTMPSTIWHHHHHRSTQQMMNSQTTIFKKSRFSRLIPILADFSADFVETDYPNRYSTNRVAKLPFSD